MSDIAQIREQAAVVLSFFETMVKNLRVKLTDLRLVDMADIVIKCLGLIENKKIFGLGLNQWECGFDRFGLDIF